MRAMLLEAPGTPLVPVELPRPSPGRGEILIRVRTCAVCRTDLHVADGELPRPKLPLVLGHEVVGVVEESGEGAIGFAPGDRAGVPWLGRTCGSCQYCRTGRENLCDDPRFTGYQLDGGYAEYMLADPRFAFRIPDLYSELEAAPLLCAGLIGYRSLRMAGDPGLARRIGIYGFGAAAHILVQVAVYRGQEVHAFTRPGDAKGQAFARRLGAVWAGGSDESPPEILDAAIVLAPVGALVPKALRDLAKGGTVVCGGIHMSDIPAFPYAILWGERAVRSVANLTREDALEFFDLAPRVPVRTEVHPYPLAEANRALEDLRHGRFEGAAVLVVGSER